MFDSKSPVIKIGGYVIIGFFTLIIIISFGVPDFVSKMGEDENVAATVNGEKIYRIDFLRYRDRVAGRIPDANKKEMQRYILDDLISRVMVIQKAREIGIVIPDDRIKENIKAIPAFQDKTGSFDKSILDSYLTYNHQSLNDFYNLVREELVIDELRRMIATGVDAAPDDIVTEYAIENSKIRIKYCFISNSDLKKNNMKSIEASKDAVDQELKKREEIKDPETDRTRVKNKLEEANFNRIKKDIVNKIDELAKEGRPFSMAAAQLGGNINNSEVFKIGDPVIKSSDKSRPLYSLSNSSVFNNELLSLQEGRTSKAITGIDGIYIFTPVSVSLSFKEPAPAEYDRIAQKIAQEKSSAVFMSMMTSMREKSKIVKFLNFN